MKKLTLRAAYGEGFRAPTLDVLTQKPAFSADSVTDLRTCIAFGRTPAQCGDANGDGVAEGTQPNIQVDATVIANPLLKPETSKQYSLGVVFDPVDWASLTLDVYNIKIDGRITNMSAQTVINRTLNPALGPVPASLSVTRDPVTNAIVNVTRGAVNEGTLDTNGFDFNIKTNFGLGTYGRLTNNFQYSHVQKYTLNSGRNLVGDQGVPKFRVVLSNDWSWKRLTANLTFNHIASQPDPVGGAPTGGYTTANAALTYEHPTKTKLTVGVINLAGKLPELQGYDGRPWNFYLYDGLGRQVYFRLSQAF
jgi:iron complex outermembrane receptor protein